MSTFRALAVTLACATLLALPASAGPSRFAARVGTRPANSMTRFFDKLDAWREIGGLGREVPALRGVRARALVNDWAMGGAVMGVMAAATQAAASTSVSPLRHGLTVVAILTAASSARFLGLGLTQASTTLVRRAQEVAPNHVPADRIARWHATGAIDAIPPLPSSERTPPR